MAKPLPRPKGGHSHGGKEKYGDGKKYDASKACAAHSAMGCGICGSKK